MKSGRRTKMSTRKGPEKSPTNIIPSGMTAEDVEDLRKAFNLFDVEDDTVVVADMLAEMEKSGLSARFPAAVALLKEVENTSEGALSFDELLQLMALDVRTASEEDDLLKLFRLLDVEGTGTLESDQVRKLFAEIGEDFSDEDWEKQFARLDQDGDGKFSFEDFLLAVGKGAEEES